MPAAPVVPAVLVFPPVPIVPATPVVPPVAFTPPVLLAPPVPVERPPLLDEQPTMLAAANSVPIAKIADKCRIFIFESPRLFVPLFELSFGEKATCRHDDRRVPLPFALVSAKAAPRSSKKIPVTAARGEKAEQVHSLERERSVAHLTCPSRRNT